MTEQYRPASRIKSGRWSRFWPLWIALGLVGLVLLWRIGPSLLAWEEAMMAFASSKEAIERFVLWAGWFGPLVLVTFHAVQIIIAPIPAYALFGAAGFLYGAFWGGVYASTGTFLGITVVMLLTRRFGQPWAERMVGADRLARWGQVTANRGLFLWGLFLLAPVGDIPYFLAGLAGVSIVRILALTLLIRIPTIFLITTAASGSTSLGWQQLAVMLIIFLIGFALVMRYQNAIQEWFEAQVRNRLARAESTAGGSSPDF